MFTGMELLQVIVKATHWSYRSLVSLAWNFEKLIYFLYKQGITSFYKNLHIGDHVNI